MPRTKIDSSRIKEIYDDISPTYDRREVIFDFLFLRKHRRKLCSQAEGHVLEVGIGTGKNFNFYPHDTHITGVDISPGMLEVAQERADTHDRVVRLMQMDAHDLIFPDDHFDTVVSTLSLCTFLDPIAALLEMARVAKPEGRIFLLEHGRSSYPRISRLLDKWAPKQIAKYGCHPNRNILALVQAANLQIMHCNRFLFGTIYAIECSGIEPKSPMRQSEFGS